MASTLKGEVFVLFNFLTSVIPTHYFPILASIPVVAFNLEVSRKKVLCVDPFAISSMRAMCPSHLIFLKFMTLAMLIGEYKLCSSLCDFLRPPACV